MAILVDKDYVDKMFDLLEAKTTLVSNAVDTIYFTWAGPANAARSRNNGYFSYLCDTKIDPTVIVTDSNAGESFKFAFTGGMKHGTDGTYGSSTMIQAVHIGHPSGPYFGEVLFVHSNDSGKYDVDNQNMLSASGSAGYSYCNIMGDAEGHIDSADSITLYGNGFSTDDNDNLLLRLSLLNVDSVNGTFNVDVVMEGGGAFEGSLYFSEIENVEFSYSPFVLSNGVNTATVTVTATDKVESSEIFVVADSESDSFILTVTRPYATSIELLKNGNTLNELELTLDENSKASGTFTVKITMDTSNAIYRDSLTFTAVDGVEFNYSIPSSNEIEVTVSATKMVNSTPITVTAISENGNLTSSFNLSVLEYDGGGGEPD